MRLNPSSQFGRPLAFACGWVRMSFQSDNFSVEAITKPFVKQQSMRVRRTEFQRGLADG